MDNTAGIGVDIEEVGRFKDLPFLENKDFYGKVFVAREIDYCLKQTNPYPHFTARFCAKEAAIKACSGRITNPLDIEITKRGDKPAIKSRLIKGKIHLSISHTEKYAVAMVIIES